MGVGIIESTFGLWGGSSDWAGKWGFEKVDEVGVLHCLDVADWSVKSRHIVKELDLSTDIEHVVEYFSTQFNLPPEGVRAFTMRLHSDENTLGYYVVRSESGLQASGALSLNPNVPGIGSLSAVHDEGDEYLESLMSALVRVAKEHGIERVFMFFTHLRPGHPLISKYESIGFKHLGSNTVYERRL
jgi:N-acetylglutamate synthase-like GNAT family acetyltransferase